MTGELDLLDWKRRIFELYAEVRASEPRAGWERWTSVRAELFRDHPQSPSPGYTSLAYYDYDPELRFLAGVEPVEEQRVEIDGFRSAASPSRGSRSASSSCTGSRATAAGSSCRSPTRRAGRRRTAQAGTSSTR